jgi:hypothetical protein
MVLGLQNYGISFDDSTFYQTFFANLPTENGGTANLQTFAGPLAGGTTLSLHAFPALLPDVWFGETRGSTALSNSQLTFTSPPGSTPGR